MSAASESILVINDGSLAALVACLMARDLERVTAWLPPSGSSLRGVGADESVQSSLVNQQADLLGYERVVAAPPLSRPIPERWIEQPQSLLHALTAARSFGCTRVVWPVVAGERIADMLEFAERAALVNRLIWLGEPERGTTGERTAPVFGAGDAHATGARDAGGGRGLQPGTPSHALRLDTPFLDLVPSQVSEIARDLDAPLQACWWTEPAAV